MGIKIGHSVQFNQVLWCGSHILSEKFEVNQNCIISSVWDLQETSTSLILFVLIWKPAIAGNKDFNDIQIKVEEFSRKKLKLSDYFETFQSWETRDENYPLSDDTSISFSGVYKFEFQISNLSCNDRVYIWSICNVVFSEKWVHSYVLFWNKQELVYLTLLK